ncbi:HNH/ENDO VII family nuclease [Emticicia sp. TH156]|uniref:HNH/ENDO VII family nuclease n=1 Tax=Emticicia sp. TH156 TaxID=2067454 RepID=UPI00130404C1|nr:HNH/ENDO VII family nuclease [Emticicia sp. TH156]
MKVEDAVSGNYDVDFVNRNSGTDDYTYYANGALKADKNEDITDIIYSTYANQPIEIQLSGSRWIKNFYDGEGRLYKTSYSTGEYWEYLDGMVFKNGAFYQLTTPEGRANYESGAWAYEYFINDHLGNTRIAYKANGSALTKTSETSFDPWGIVLKDVGAVNSFQNKFEYQNKEKESTFNLRRISFGARTYNASIGRFDGVDELAEKMSFSSSYAFSLNNPIRFVDPNGAAPFDITLLGANNSSVTVKTDLIDLKVNASGLGIDFGGNYTLSGNDVLQAVVDIGGVFDPTPTLDAFGAYLSAKSGDYFGAGASVMGAAVPFVGDLAKTGKIAKGIDKISDAIESTKSALKIDIDDANKINRELLNPPKKHGNAPTFKKDDTPVEIHHEGQKREGPFKEMHWEDHRGKGNDALNHPNKNKPSQVDRKEFDKAKREYWKQQYPKK